MYQIDRREFLKSSIAVTGGAFAISGTKSSGNSWERTSGSG